MKKALVISGGGSKGAFAGGVTQYLMEEEKRQYDLFVGTSTGSLLVSHLAAQKDSRNKTRFYPCYPSLHFFQQSLCGEANREVDQDENQPL